MGSEHGERGGSTGDGEVAEAEDGPSDSDGDASCISRRFVLDLGEKTLMQVEGAGRKVVAVADIGSRGVRAAAETVVSSSLGMVRPGDPEAGGPETDGQ